MNLYFFNLIHSLAGKWWILDLIAIFFAKYLGYFLILAALILILKEKKTQNKIYFLSFTILSLILSRGIIAEIIKFFIHNPRPFSVLNFKPLIEANGVDMALPSGHAAFYFALALPIFFLDKNASYWFFGGAAIMGIARIFTGVHWPGDILAGAIIGVLSGLLIGKILPEVEVG
ncbi:phosphatase PAP2 family protein [Candidatus Wolfebacteria bacterium]|nr:phosphatase PAP2 family protein [Candidatus Wolfebacteria bacterium]